MTRPLYLRLIEGLVVLGIIYLLVRSVMALLAPESLWQAHNISSNATTTSQVQPLGQSKSLSQFSIDPFNRDLQPSIVKADENADAPETTLNLILLGLRASSGSAGGSAVLKTSDGKQRNYVIGEEVIDGVTLKSVSKDFVVLSVDGRVERLTFEAVKNGTSLAIAQAVVTPDEKADAQAPKLKSQDLTSKAFELALAKSVRLAKDGQRIIGLKLINTQLNYGATRLNLKDHGFAIGDIVTHINGQQLVDASKGPLVNIGSLVGKGEVDLTFLRDGTSKTVQLTLE